MAVISELEVKISAQMGEVTAQIAALKKQLESVEPSTKKASESFSIMATAGKALAGIGIANTLYNIGKAAITGAAALEQNTVAFEVMIGNAKTAQKLIQDIQKFAAATPFDQPALIEAAKALLNYGTKADQVMPVLSRISDVASGNAEKLQSLTMAYGKVTSSGKLTGETLESMIFAGFNPLNEISKKTGESMGQLRKRMEEGALTAKEVEGAFKAATDKGGMFFEMNKKQSATAAGQFSTLIDNVKMLATSFGQDLEPMVKMVLGSLNSLLDAYNNYIAIKEGPDKVRRLQEYTDGINQAKILLKNYEGASTEVYAKEISYLKDTIKELDSKRNKLGIINRQMELEGSVQAALDAAQKGRDKAKEKGPDLTSKYIEQRKTLQGINDDFDKQRLTQEKKTQELLALEEKISIKKVTDLNTQSEASKQEAIKKIQDVYRKKREEEESASWQRTAQGALQTTAQLTGQIGSIVSQYYTNKNTQVDNTRTRELEAIQAAYDTEKLAIESSVLTQAQKNESLKALDEKRARDEKKANEKAEKEKRKLARDAFIYQQGIAVAQTIIAGAQATITALTAGPFAGPILAGIVAALSAAQVALIASQPPPALAQGGYFQGPALIGEQGREFAFPLDGPQGKNAMREMASGILDVMSQSADRSATISASAQAPSGGGNVYLDGALVGKYIQDGTRNGTIFIDGRGVV